MQNLENSEVLGSIIAGWNSSNKNQIWQKKEGLITKELKNIAKLIDKLSENEMDFLQNFYINLSDGNLRSTKILELSSRYPHAEYFFHDKFFDSNLDIFYYDFVFKNKIVDSKPLFENSSNISVEEVIKDDSKDAISLYIFIENIVKNFNSYAKDKDKKDEFKIKLIAFYESIYKLFIALNGWLRVSYFDIVLHNHPLILVEFISKAISADDYSKVETYLSEEGMLNLGEKDADEFHAIGKSDLYSLLGIFSIDNKETPTCVYFEDSVRGLETIYKTKIHNFHEFAALCTKFVDEYSPYPAGSSYLQKYVYASLFFDFVSSFERKALSKNTLILATLGGKKDSYIKDLIISKKLKNDQFRLIKLHKNSSYSNFMDGFVGDKFINGEFKNLCKTALKNLQNDYFLILDNTSGVNLDEIFAESTMLFSNRYNPQNPLSIVRSKNSHLIDGFEMSQRELCSVVLKDEASYFALPENLYIICILNPDYQGLCAYIAKDFDAVRLYCDYDALLAKLSNLKNASSYVEICKKINAYISKESRLNALIDEFLFAKILNFTNSLITDEHLTHFFDSVLLPVLTPSFRAKFPELSYAKQLQEIRELCKI